MTRLAIVYALFGDRAAAEATATRMIEAGLAACANVQAPCLSIFRWEGTMERAEETPVLFKTAPARRDALMAALAHAHDYAVPAISSWEAETTADYGAWVAGTAAD